MKTKILLFASLLIVSLGNAQTWSTIATDASGDGSDGSLLDGTLFEYSYNTSADSLFFRITNAGISNTQSTAVGVNIMANFAGGGSTFNFWGADNSAAYHRLLTVWVTGSAPSSYSGTIGVSDASGVNSSNYTSLSSNNISINVNTSTGTIVLGLLREALIPNSGLDQPATLAAAVGSNQFWNDDLYDPSSSITLSSGSVGIAENQVLALDLFPNPATDVLNIQAENSYTIELISITGAIVYQGRGSQLTSLSTTAFKPGLYALRISNDSGVSTKRVVLK